MRKMVQEPDMKNQTNDKRSFAEAAAHQQDNVAPAIAADMVNKTADLKRVKAYPY